MDIPHTSAFPTVNALARSLGYHAFLTHELFLSYLRWLDQSYGKTITCTLNADLSAMIDVHGVHQLTLKAEQGRLWVQWVRPDTRYRSVLQQMSNPGDLPQTPDGTSWQFYVDTQQDGYLLRDLTGHLHQEDRGHSGLR